MKNNRIINLDLFRALAILFVLNYHVSQNWVQKRINNLFYDWGQYGVDMFFLLSGFLVCSLYLRDLKNNNFSFKSFWIKRFIRTYPPYMVVLTLAFAVVFITRHQAFDFGYLLFFQNFYDTIPYFRVSWSLCVEEHFYLFFPIIIYLISKIKSPQKLMLFWLSIALLPLLTRYFFGNPENIKFGYYKTATIFRYDCIAIGCLLGTFVNTYKFSISRTMGFILIAALTSIWIPFGTYIIVNHTAFNYTIGYTLFSFLTASILLILVKMPDLKIAENPVIKQIALMAYSIYLLHPLVIHVSNVLVPKLGIKNIPISLLITYSLIFTCAYAFYQIVEKPCVTIKDKIFLKHKHKVNKMAAPGNAPA